MSKEDSKDILSPFGKKAVKYLSGRSVGGSIPSSEYGEWEKYKKRCGDIGVSVSCEGFLDMLRTHNKINDAIFPIAHSYGYNPLSFKNEIINILLETITVLDNKQWVKESDKLHKSILDGTEETLLVKLKEKVKQ